MSKQEPSDEELVAMRNEIGEVSRAMASAMFATSQDKRVTTVAALRLATGTAYMAGLDMHKVMEMVMSFYKEAKAQMKGKRP